MGILSVERTRVGIHGQHQTTYIFVVSGDNKKEDLNLLFYTIFEMYEYLKRTLNVDSHS